MRLRDATLCCPTNASEQEANVRGDSIIGYLVAASFITSDVVRATRGKKDRATNTSYNDARADAVINGKRTALRSFHLWRRLRCCHRRDGETGPKGTCYGQRRQSVGVKKGEGRGVCKPKRESVVAVAIKRGRTYRREPLRQVSGLRASEEG